MKYAVKLKRTGGRKLWGLMGHDTALSYQDVVELILKNGIKNVQVIRHDDPGSGGKGQLNTAEMLAVWKAVELRRGSLGLF